MSRAIVVFGHGSRDPLWRQPMDAVAARLRARAPDIAVECAFLELQEPDLPAALSSLVRGGATSVVVVPLFLGVGRHAREDLPLLLAAARATHPGVAIDAMPAVGEWPGLLDAIADETLKRS